MKEQIKVEGLPAAPIGCYWAAGAAIGTMPVVCAATSAADEITTGIVPELRKVMDLAMNNESDLKRMLEVAVSLLTKARSGSRFENNGEMVDAALVVVTAVYEWMNANTTPGTVGVRTAIVNRMKAKTQRIMVNAMLPGGAGSAGSYSAPMIANTSPSSSPEAEWRANAQLRAEFGDSEASYLAFQKAKDAGLVRMYEGNKGTSAIACGTAGQQPGNASASVVVINSERDPKGQWDASPQLRAEFRDDFGAFSAYCEAERRGLIGSASRRP